MKKLSILIGILFLQNVLAQEEKCGLQKSEFNIYKVNAEDVKCLAKNSDKRNTIFFTFARWCTPCLYHLPNFKKIEEFYSVDSYVLLIDNEGSNMTKLAVDYVLEGYPNAKIVVLKDKEKKNGRKYKDFLKEITPSQSELVTDMSKYIVLNTSGEVQLVTSWKDNKEYPEWKDDSSTIKRIVLPLLEKK
ncbi:MULTISPECIES: thioredoxin family protein [Chryseobacterium]|uniref:thioredoxin family protein n=1 Tax=Chryseobacterium TaxID=59732 RepID=UPI00289BC82E|nr:MULTISPECIES: thioredoxin family protein [Chryseobacterium]MEC5173311.1 thiol-disulfide isomerase/thioredoxin [Chryseobacterium nepalense]